MRQAFLIVAHKNFEQTKQLIEFIADENHHAYVHIDKKNNDLFLHLKTYFQNNEYVYLIEPRVSIHWGGFSQVKATLRILTTAVSKQYDFYHLISGQDLFIKPKTFITEFLQRHKGKQFLEVKKIGDELWRVKGYYPLNDNKYNRSRPMYLIRCIFSSFFKRFPIRPNLKGFEIYKGSNWFTLSGDCVEYILSYLDNHPTYIKDYQYTICSDEHFFQTLILNSPFKETVIQNTLREIQWDGGANPKTYTVKDYDLLCESPALFARKFDSDIDDEIIKKVYEHIQ